MRRGLRGLRRGFGEGEVEGGSGGGLCCDDGGGEGGVEGVEGLAGG